MARVAGDEMDFVWPRGCDGANARADGPNELIANANSSEANMVADMGGGDWSDCDEDESERERGAWIG